MLKYVVKVENTHVFVSGPDFIIEAENEKTETVRVTKELSVSLSPYSEIEAILTVYIKWTE